MNNTASQSRGGFWLGQLFRQPEGIAVLGCLAGLLGGWAFSGREQFGGLSTGLYALSYVSGGWYATRSAVRELFVGQVDVDLLMVLAALGAAYVGAPAEGAVLLFLFSLSNLLQEFAVERSRNAVRSLMSLRPDVALVLRGGEYVEVAAAEVGVGEVIQIRPGGRIALDGTVIEGFVTVDQASMTGESLPVDKHPGSGVFGGTVVVTGSADVRVTAPADQSLLSRMVHLVEAAQANKARTQRFLEKFEQRYAIGVIGFTVGLILVPLLFGERWGEAMYRAMTVMVVMSPCALVISIPATILAAIAGAARQGMLFKGGVHLERAATIEVVAFDKTGTLTEGRPGVREIQPWHDMSEDELLVLGASVSQKSEHPVAQAMVRAAVERGLELKEPSDFRSFVGKGTEAVVGGRRISVGNTRSLVSHGGCGDIIAHSGDIDDLAERGMTPVAVAERLSTGDVRVWGLIAVSDTVRADARSAVAMLRRIGVQKVVMITGDDRRVAAAVAKEVGIDEVHADLMPEDKVRVIQSLQRDGFVAMVGDGVNDAPSLAAAQLGIAIGTGGTDVALESADVVLMGRDLGLVGRVLNVGRRARFVVIQNLVFAGLVMAILTVSALFGTVPLTLGVIGHEGSTILVCLNGLRLLSATK